MKIVRFVGNAKNELSAFPAPVRVRAGHELFLVQMGRNPADWKPMTSVGAGVREIRVRDESGAFRVIYVAGFGDAVYVLHAFKKTTQKTPQLNLELAKQRYRTARALAKGANDG